MRMLSNQTMVTALVLGNQCRTPCIKMAKLVSVLCPYCARKNKLSPEVKSNESIATATKVTIDEDSDNEADGWSVAGIFRKFFHASPDSKLAVKLYGSKKSVVHEKKRQSKGGTRWMIHPCSHFR